jgi:hypothetical protein
MSFFVMPLKHVLSVIDLVNHPGTPKLWAIAHENGHKRKSYEFFIIPLENVQTVIFLVNHHGTPKLWAIAVIAIFWPNKEMGRNQDGLGGYTCSTLLDRPCA